MTRKILINIAVLLVSLPGISVAQVPLSTQEQSLRGSSVVEVPLSTQEQKFSYAMGFKVATELQQKLSKRGVQLDSSAFVQAVQDVLSGAQPRLSEEAMQAVIQLHLTQQAMKQATEAMNNTLAGDRFREVNRAKEGVIETASGLQYRVLKEGDGQQPTAADTVVVQYRGTLVNGKEFDSSYARGEPATFDLNKVIVGLREALQLMHEGGKWELVIPPELAYGQKGSGDIGPNETLIFEIELISVK